MTEPPANSGHFLSELRRRRVVRAALVYAAAGFAVLEAADVAFPRLGLPDWTVTFVLALVGLGFPITLGLAWVFDFSADGVIRTGDAPTGDAPEGWLTGRTITVMAVAITVGLGAGWFARGGSASGMDLGDGTRIAVLPFENMSGDPENEYFSDGLSEQLIDVLARLPGLRVTARTSSFSFKGKGATIGDIGRALGVDVVVEGSVRKDGDRVRITAQLIEVENEFHMWTATYDRDLVDVFAVQDEIALTISEQLQLELTAEESAAAVSIAANDLEAWDQYLLGRYHLARRPGELAEAVAAFERAVELDPDYPPALAGLAMAYMVRPFYVPEPDMGDLQRARSYSLRAQALDPRLGQPNGVLGYSSLMLLDWTPVGPALKRGLELSPDDADLRHWYADYLSIFGRFDEALEQTRLAVQLDPLSPMRSWKHIEKLAFAGRIDEGRAEMAKARSAFPGYRSQVIQGVALAMLGETKDVIEIVLWRLDQDGVAISDALRDGLLGIADGEPLGPSLVDEMRGNRTLIQHVVMVNPGASDALKPLVLDLLSAEVVEVHPASFFIGHIIRNGPFAHDPEVLALLREMGVPTFWADG